MIDDTFKNQEKLEKLHKLLTENCGYDDLEAANFADEILEIFSDDGAVISKANNVVRQSLITQKYCTHEHKFLFIKWTTRPSHTSEYLNCPDCGKVLQETVLGSSCNSCGYQDKYKFWKVSICPKCGSANVNKGFRKASYY